MHQSPWYRLTSIARGVYRLERTARAFSDAREMERAVSPLIETLEKLHPEALLIDLREAPPRNDPEFEAKFAAHRLRMSQIPREAALLVRTQVGRLQVSRLARSDGVSLTVFDDERRALEWLAARAKPAH